jgi:outer membrane protein assembly factor BamE
MHMLHKYYLVGCMLIALAGCIGTKQTAQQTTSDTPASANQITSKSASGSASENLSAQTVAPAGFEKFLGIFTPYRITIQQGNFVSREMADQVKEGMTREQVRFILGTPLLTDMFHADRWDYIFRLLKPSGELITSRVTVYFHQSLVSKIERGDLPDEKEYLSRITSAAILDGNDND